MIRFCYTLCAAIAILLLVNLVPVLSQMGGKEEPKADPHSEWEKLQTPGPEHKAMAEEAGDYVVSAKFWMEPGKDPFEMKGTSKIIHYRNRYVIEEVTFGEGEQAMKMMIVRGYDNSAKEWQSVAFGDNMTALHVLSGNADPKTGVVTLSGSWVEKGFNNMKYSERIVVTPDPKDMTSGKVEGFSKFGDAPEMKTFEMTFAKKK